MIGNYLKPLMALMICSDQRRSEVGECRYCRKQNFGGKKLSKPTFNMERNRQTKKVNAKAKNSTVFSLEKV